MKTLRWAAAVPIVALIILVSVWEWRQLPAPGPLHPSHAGIESLAGRRGCARCHVPDGPMRDGCLACHDSIQDDLVSNRNLHGSDAVRADACQRCHPGHSGAALPLTGPMAFTAAGLEDRSDRPHRFTAPFDLHGRHADLDCVACHVHADAPALAAGQRRFGGLAQACTACHEDVHEGGFGPDCTSCHGQDHPFAAVAAFEHPAVFPLEDVHAGLACAECHEHGIDAAPSEALRTCRDCHPSRHDPGFIARVGAALAERDSAPSDTCAVCHDATPKGFTWPQARMPADLHAASGFALELPHADTACEACHADGATTNAVTPRRADDCASCHDDPHAGQFRSHPTAGRCSACHADDHFVPSTLDAAWHEQCDFALDGAHGHVDCRACHTLVDDVRRFTATPTACSDCHADVHAGQFGAVQACSACHSVTAFVPSSFDEERHAHTRFPLEGAHAGLGCAECHLLDGPTRRFAATPTDCAACHADAHAGQFTPERSCGECHGVRGFIPTRFDHDMHARTRFELDGAHRAIACAQCHPRDGASRRFVPTPVACAECHGDVHDGQVARLEGVDSRMDGCLACHGTSGFRPVIADAEAHARWFGVELVGGHAGLQCTACHERTSVPGSAAVRLGSAATACASCHTDVHAGQFRRNGVNDCARCHDQHSFAASGFDHDRDSSFPLDALHAALECGACHRPVATDIGSIVRYVPLGTACRDCHGPGGGTP